MKFKSKITSFETNFLGYESHIPIPNDIYVNALKFAPDKRVKCIFNNSYEHYCAMTPQKDSYHYILLNKVILKELGLRINDSVDVEIQKQNLKYGIPICKELEEVLVRDPEGSDFFHTLTAGKQRSLIHVINKYKNPQLRIDRSILMLRHLILRNGDLDFRILNQSFKEGL